MLFGVTNKHHTTIFEKSDFKIILFRKIIINGNRHDETVYTYS
jgi:hypothetical protein